MVCYFLQFSYDSFGFFYQCYYSFQFNTGCSLIYFLFDFNSYFLIAIFYFESFCVIFFILSFSVSFLGDWTSQFFHA